MDFLLANFLANILTELNLTSLEEVGPSVLVDDEGLFLGWEAEVLVEVLVEVLGTLPDEVEG